MVKKFDVNEILEKAKESSGDKGKVAKILYDYKKCRIENLETKVLKEIYKEKDKEKRAELLDKFLECDIFPLVYECIKIEKLKLTKKQYINRHIKNCSHYETLSRKYDKCEKVIENSEEFKMQIEEKNNQKKKEIKSVIKPRHNFSALLPIYCHNNQFGI